MAGFDSILGQQRIVDSLRAAVAAGRVHHAYLFEGPAGVGKASLARAFAMALNCERSTGCGACDPCLKIEGGTHPDVIFFDMTPKGLTERVRELVGLCGFRPHEGRARVVVIDPADILAGRVEGAPAQAANALLKTLEEPPAGTHFVLCTAEARRLPVTVQSRCQRLRFAPVDEETIVSWLVAQHGADQESARNAARACGGSPGRALSEIAAGEDAARRQTLLVRMLDTLKRPTPSLLFETAAEVGADREEADEVCGLLWHALRDALLCREGLDAGRVSPARAGFAEASFAAWPPATLFGAIALTDEARQLLRGNVAPQLVLEHLLLALAPGLAEPRRAQQGRRA
jgi:DNA polymerase-3 subunit delta'